MILIVYSSQISDKISLHWTRPLQHWFKGTTKQTNNQPFISLTQGLSSTKKPNYTKKHKHRHVHPLHTLLLLLKLEDLLFMSTDFKQQSRHHWATPWTCRRINPSEEIAALCSVNTTKEPPTIVAFSPGSPLHSHKPTWTIHFSSSACKHKKRQCS